MDADQIKNWAELITAVGAVRTTVYVAIAGLFILAIAGYALHLWWKARLRAIEAREEAARQKAKGDRAEKYTKALNGLSASVTSSAQTMQAALLQLQQAMQSANMSSSSTAQLTTTALVRLEGAITRLMVTNDELAGKLTAKLSTKDSVHLIGRVLQYEVYHESLKIVRKAIIDNNYEDNAEAIGTRVRSDLREIVRRYRDYLQAFQALSIPVSDFFELSGDPSLERFTLSEALWSIAKVHLEAAAGDPPREHTNLVAQRLELAEYEARNAIQGYYQAICLKLYPQLFETGKHLNGT